jgi:predicted ATPase/class 3 adenylate cyclase
MGTPPPVPASERELPQTGLVTFLFTDVVGSTAAWDTHPELMGPALERHDALVEQAVSASSGTLVRPRGEGDSRFAVFVDAADALLAALRVDAAVSNEPWPPDVELVLRIAVHSGWADLRSGDYYGSAVNRCARLRSLAHPGQILASQSTVDAVAARPLGGVRLTELGVHWLKDLTLPERVYQVDAADRARTFPPLVSLGSPLAAPGHAELVGVPDPSTPLVGRQREVAEVLTRLREPGVRVLTLTGPGGVGKTRLAVEVAQQAAPHFPGGVVFVPLTAVEDPALVLTSIAATLDLPDTDPGAISDALAVRFGSARSLLILDNLEQLLDAVPALAELLQRLPGIRLLVTSRVQLRLTGEQEYPVPPLGLPDLAAMPSVEELGRNEAVELFVARSRSIVPSFTLDSVNARAVAEICVRLDGLPLALELAAARVKVLRPAELLVRLDRCLEVLVGGGRDLPGRQRTLRATLEWSYGLLEPREQVLLARLGVFAGSFGLQAAEVVCGDGPGDLGVLDGLEALVDNSLVRADEDSPGLRFRLLQTVREYAQELLEVSGDRLTMQRRHLHHMVESAESCQAALDGPDAALLTVEMTADEPNLRAAFQFAADDGDLRSAARLAIALRPFWIAQGRLAEGRSWLRELYDSDQLPSDVRPAVTVAAGILAYYQDDLREASEHLRSGLTGAREREDTAVTAAALCFLSSTTLASGDLDQARRLADEALALSRSAGLYETHVLSLSVNAMLAALAGDGDGEKQILEERLRLVRRRGDTNRIADTLNTLAEIALEESDHPTARALAEEALGLAGPATTLTARDLLLTLGRVAIAEGDADLAMGSLRTALELCVEFDQRSELAQCLRALAAAEVVAGEPLRAARLYGAAERLHAQLGSGETFPLERDLAALRDRAQNAVGSEAFESACLDGGRTAVEEIIADALSSSGT